MYAVVELGDLRIALTDLKTRIGGIATALVSRDGRVLCADVPAGVHPETFAIMCATILGAAATANTELSRAPPERIVVEGNDSKTIIVGSGTKALLVAVVDRTSDVTKLLGDVVQVAGSLATG